MDEQLLGKGMRVSRQTGLLLLPLGGEAHSRSLGQHLAPIELIDLGIVVCFRDGVLCENEPSGKAPKTRGNQACVLIHISDGQRV